MAAALIGVLSLGKLQVQCQGELVELFLQNFILLFQVRVFFLPGTAWIRNFGITSVLNRTHLRESLIHREGIVGVSLSDGEIIETYSIVILQLRLLQQHVLDLRIELLDFPLPYYS